MFTWIPGEGFDEAACARLTAAFPRPAEPMGEAWFMGGERKMFHNLMGDLQLIPVEHLMDALNEMTSGMTCFGPYPEWIDWYHYLLGRLIPRSHESHVDYLLE